MLLEVERKFCSRGVGIIAANAGDPPFRSLVFRGAKKFCDVYYDRDELLRSAGIYLRRRETTWEAKVRAGGNFVNSSFDEITCESRIAELVRQRLRLEHLPRSSHAFGLADYATIETVRHTWLANSDFKIVHDQTQFGHMVGEVELEEDLPDDVKAEEKDKIRKSMNRKIQYFMNRHAWAFPCTKPIPKLTAFSEWQKKQHQQL